MRLSSLFAIAATVPLVVLISMQRQEIRQEASGKIALANEFNKKEEAEFSSNEFLIKFKPKISSSLRNIAEETQGSEIKETKINELDKIAQIAKVEKIEPILKKSAVKALKSNSAKDEVVKSANELDKWYKVTLKKNKEIIKKDSPLATGLIQAISLYKSNPDIETIELNYKVSTNNLPNDTYIDPDGNNTWATGSWAQAYEDMWGLKKINMESVWNESTPAANTVVVADIDTGVDYNHEDLADNIWTNPGESGDGKESNGVDDDNNGYIDDFRGWKFANKDSNNPMDNNGHGTHTAGTIAAAGNNRKGVAGINQNTKIMIVKFLDNTGAGSLADAAKALVYAADMGAKVSSNSWGCQCQSELTDDAIEYAHNKGMVTVVAAGNSNADALDFSPASSDRAITVAASDYNDLKADFSNWGEKIDVIAPGVDILSARASINSMCDSSRTVGSNYCKVSGTSMSTPHVAGLAALILSRNPDLSNEQVRQIIRMGAADLGESGKDINFGYGRIDIGKSLNIKDPLSPIITSPKSRSSVSGTDNKIMGSIGGANFSNYKIEVGGGRSPTSWTTIANSNSPVSNGLLANFDAAKLNDGMNIVRAVETDTLGRTYYFQVNDIEADNFDASIIAPQGITSSGNVEITGAANVKTGLTFNNYSLEWGLGKSPASWSQSGVTLDNGGTKPVINGKLGALDTSNFTDGQEYSIRLTVYSAFGNSGNYTTVINIDKLLVPGWPKVLQSTNTAYSWAIVPAISDLDNDGKKELVALEPDGKVYVFRKDGTNFPNFPVQIEKDQHFIFPVNIEDLDGDGKKEIIAAANGSHFDQAFVKIYIIKSDGAVYPGWPNLTFPASWNFDMTPAVSDLNMDGKKELVFFDCAGKLHALNLDGIEISGFPKQTLDSNAYCGGGSAITVADINNDEKPEIILGSSDKLYVFDNLGNVLPGWPYSAPLYNGKPVYFQNGLATGDVNGDGKMDIFTIGIVKDISSIAGEFNRGIVYGFNHDGSTLPGWPVDNGWLNSNLVYIADLYTPAIFDMNKDGKMEIAITGWGKDYAGFDDRGLGLRVYDGEGNLKFKEKLATDRSFASRLAPAIADIDGDGKLEIAAGNDFTLRIIDDNGDPYWEKHIWLNQDGHFLLPQPIISDMDNNGKIELAIVRVSAGWGYGTDILYLWEIPSNSQAKYEWPMHAHDSSRTSNFTYGVSFPTNTPSPTPTPLPYTKLNLTLTLPGIGLNTGDNPNPVNKKRNVNVQVFNSSNTKLLERNSVVTYASASGKFKGPANLRTTLPAGVYSVKVKIDKYLRQTLNGIQITDDRYNYPAQTTLLPIDRDNNDIVTQDDYTNYTGCYNQQQTCAEINDDSKIDITDFNLFLKYFRLISEPIKPPAL